MKNSDTRRNLLWLARPRISCCSSNPVYPAEVSRFAAKARDQLVAWTFSQPPFLPMSIKHYAIFNGIVKRPRVLNSVTREVVEIYSGSQKRELWGVALCGRSGLLKTIVSSDRLFNMYRCSSPGTMLSIVLTIMTFDSCLSVPRHETVVFEKSDSDGPSSSARSVSLTAPGPREYPPSL